MTETIKGGAYLRAGKWYDANGKPLPDSVVAKLEAMNKEKEAVQAEQAKQQAEVAESIEEIFEEDDAPVVKKKSKKKDAE